MCIHLLRIQIYFLGDPGTEMGIWGVQLFGASGGDLGCPTCCESSRGLMSLHLVPQKTCLP